MGAELKVDTISEKTSSNGVVIDLVTLKDGVVNASGINLGSAALVESELEMLDGITAGTVIASKALVADENIDITAACAPVVTSISESGSDETLFSRLSLIAIFSLSRSKPAQDEYEKFLLSILLYACITVEWSRLPI